MLVTHDMTAVQHYCHRAMLLDEGRLRYIGDPEEAGRQYLRMNFARANGHAATGRSRSSRTSSSGSSTPGSRTPTASGSTNVEVGEPIRLHAVIEAPPGPGEPGLRAPREQRRRRRDLRARPAVVGAAEGTRMSGGVARNDQRGDREPADCPGATRSSAGSACSATRRRPRMQAINAPRVRRLRDRRGPGASSRSRARSTS